MPEGIWNDEETLLVIVLMKLRDEKDDEVLYNERLPANWLCEKDPTNQLQQKQAVF